MIEFFLSSTLTKRSIKYEIIAFAKTLHCCNARNKQNSQFRLVKQHLNQLMYQRQVQKSHNPVQINFENQLCWNNILQYANVIEDVVHFHVHLKHVHTTYLKKKTPLHRVCIRALTWRRITHVEPMCGDHLMSVHLYRTCAKGPVQVAQSLFKSVYVDIKFS